MVVSSSQQADLEARFAHLLQPIRDLTKNWDVNIASQLEDYLEEIGSIAITFDGGQTTLNFAEAALLIQGSACVYSKKVEYLHALVYQVLDLLASKKKLQHAASLDGEGNDRDAAFTNKDQDEEFLSLDDIKDHKNIDLKEDHDNHRDKVTPALPRVTLSLIPLEEGEKGCNPLLSHKGEILGSRNDFRMNTSNIHASGTLLLDLSHLNLLELSFQNKPHSTPFVPRAVSKLTEDVQTVALATDEENPIDEGLPADISMEDNASFNQPPVGDDVQTGENAQMEIVDEKAQDQMQLRRSARNKNVIVKPVVKQVVDPWLRIEPHEEMHSEKVFKKKKMYKSIEAEDNKKRKRDNKSLTLGKQRLVSLSEFCKEAFYVRSTHCSRQPLKAPTFQEFEQLYWAEFKNRQQRLRTERKRMEEQGRHEELQEELQDDADDDNYNEPPPGAAGDDDGEDNDVIRRVDFQIPEVDDLGPMQPPENQEVDGFMGPPTTGDMFDDVPVMSSYEELVRHHVEGYLASAQQYAQITELARRVNEWEEKIIPKLEEEEKHGPFDIHKYGTDVIDSLQNQAKCTENLKDTVAAVTDGQRIQFRRVCQNRQPYEVCRMFLATLQLANNYNVEISSEGTLSDAMDTMSLRMLSSRRHFEELEEYRAPSLDH